MAGGVNKREFVRTVLDDNYLIGRFSSTEKFKVSEVFNLLRDHIISVLIVGSRSKNLAPTN
jgi:hypothetical protein